MKKASGLIYTDMAPVVLTEPEKYSQFRPVEWKCKNIEECQHPWTPNAVHPYRAFSRINFSQE
jgi:hypothetical protein